MFRVSSLETPTLFGSVSYFITGICMLNYKLSEPISYGDLVYKFKRIVGKPNFSDQSKKIIKCYIKVGYNLDAMRQTVCMPGFKPNHGL